MRHKIVVALAILGLAITPLSVSGAPATQDIPLPEDLEVLELMEDMSVEQRVGQLFLVTFTGSEVSADNAIGQLLQQYHVGGVVLSASNDNFTSDDELALQTLQLVNSLQQFADPTTVLDGEQDGPPVELPFIPLFIAIQQEGDGYPNSQLLSDTTPLPSNMAVGASWNLVHAQQVGNVVGSELNTLGINMLLGPSLDVLEVPQPTALGDLGVRSFGGDSFWVSRMGAAYVSGVHQGSAGRILVIPKHFPGVGSADREATVEVPTVRRSLAQLVQVDLAPFFEVTGRATDTDAIADGLLTAHIRYLGFQGDNPRLPTRPISLDPQALQVLMEQSQIVQWRQSNGLLISDALGRRAIRRFYDPSEESFAHRRIAQDAFLAGNDVLLLDQFGPTPDADQTQNVIDTIEFFVQKYETDPTFQVRVDEAVARILRKKIDRLGPFTLLRAQRSPNIASQLGQRNEVTVSVAQNALTLLSPSQDELIGPPQSGDHIVVFTDTRAATQCSSCQPHPLVSMSALADAIFRLYGPGASGLVRLADVQSFSFEQLDTFLEFGPSLSEEGEPTPEPDPIAVALNRADWIIFVMLDVDAEVPTSNAVKRFLAERTDVATDVNVVVMAMNAPYFLDATEISKLSAYYALYAKSEAFVDMAARALFQEVLPSGAPPVSVAGIDYEILSATSPDPFQVIELQAGLVPLDPDSTPEPFDLQLGDTARISTGLILDQNGNPVPDGTPVDLNVNFVNEGLTTTQRATTTDGSALFNLPIERVGQIEITASSEPAQLSFTLTVNVSEEGDVDILPVPPEVTPTVTLSPPETPETELSVVGPTPTPAAPPIEPEIGLALGDLLVSLIGLAVISGLSFQFALLRNHTGNDRLFPTLTGLVGGLLFYNYYALSLPGAILWRGLLTGILGASLATWIGGLLGIAAAFGILRWRRQ